MNWLIIFMISIYVLYCLAFILFQSQFIFRSERLQENYVFNADANFEEINVTAKDGTRLNSILLQPHSDKGLVIYFHGNCKNLDNYIPFTKKFTDLGYSVLMPDYRSYGKSEGRLTEKLFYTDTEEWYAIATRTYAPEKILIYGHSLGTAAATYLASKHLSNQLILETPFANMYDIGRRYGMLFPDGYYLPFSFRTDVMIQKVQVPILILHGDKDETVSMNSAKKLRQFLKDEDRFVVIENGKHKNLHLFQDYHTALNNFLNDG